MNRCVEVMGVVGGAALLMLAGSGAIAAEAEVAADLNSAYVWRGITYTDGPVVQPYLEVAHSNGLSLNVWANMNLDDSGGSALEGQFSEVDLTARYDVECGPAELGLGITEYLYPHQSEETEALHGTREIFAFAEFGLPAGFGAGTDVNYDIDEADDVYVDVYVKYGKEITEALGTELRASVGYAGQDWAIYNSGGVDGGFHDVTADWSVSYALTDAVGVSGHIAWTDSLDKDVLPEQDVNVYGGGSLSYAF